MNASNLVLNALRSEASHYAQATAAEVAKKAGVSTSTARRWLEQFVFQGSALRLQSWEVPHSNYSRIAHINAPAHKVIRYRYVAPAKEQA